MKRQRGINSDNHELTQNFPSEAWLQIYQFLYPDYWVSYQNPAKEFKFWLGCRTVSKSWRSWIAKIDFPPIVGAFQFAMTMNLPNVLSLFKVSRLIISQDVKILAVSALTKVKDLLIYHKKALPLNEWPLLTQLTQLESMTIYGGLAREIPQKNLHCFTNLKSLTLFNAGAHIKSLQALTNLQKLILLEEHGLTQAHIQQHLTKLTRLTSDDPSFFKSGKGHFQNEGAWDYDGEWKDGNRHGFGKCGTASFDPTEGTYEGEWVDDEPHGKGVFTFTNRIGISTYTGDWARGKRNGKGFRQYQGGDTYNGDWVNGKRSGHGVYTLKAGVHTLVYDGEWKNGQINGFGKCTYPDGSTFEGNWKEGQRSGEGVYTQGSNGSTLHGGDSFLVAESDGEEPINYDSEPEESDTYSD